MLHKLSEILNNENVTPKVGILGGIPIHEIMYSMKINLQKCLLMIHHLENTWPIKYKLDNDLPRKRLFKISIAYGDG